MYKRILAALQVTLKELKHNKPLLGILAIQGLLEGGHKLIELSFGDEDYTSGMAIKVILQCFLGKILPNLATVELFPVVERFSTFVNSSDQRQHFIKVCFDAPAVG